MEHSGQQAISATRGGRVVRTTSMVMTSSAERKSAESAFLCCGDGAPHQRPLEHGRDVMAMHDRLLVSPTSTPTHGCTLRALLLRP